MGKIALTWDALKQKIADMGSKDAEIRQLNIRNSQLEQALEDQQAENSRLAELLDQANAQLAGATRDASDEDAMAEMARAAGINLADVTPETVAEIAQATGFDMVDEAAEETKKAKKKK
jgi:hypothetical protein